MAIENLVASVDPYIQAPTGSGDTGTTQKQFRDFTANMFNAMQNILNSVKLWQAQTAYVAGEVIRSPAMEPNTCAYVQIAGTTGTAEPTWTDAGTTVTDGNVTYLMVPVITVFASDDEITTGTEDAKAVSPKTLTNYGNSMAQKMEKEMNSISLPISYYAPADITGSQLSVTIPADFRIQIGDTLYILTEAKTIDISTLEIWDDHNLGVAVNRKGKDFYIYACVPESGTEPDFILSGNSTVPTGSGYNADNTRKVGGFHCECADVGTITGHPLSGYVAGDILPASVWDLWHRDDSGVQEGMAYDDISDTWFFIYGASWDGSRLVSAYNGIWADGSSTKKWHGEASLEQLMKQGMRLPWRHEFQMAAKGSNEQTNIKGSADPNTTGGHVDTANRRMISNIGLEDCCGVLWQWFMDLGFAGGSGWTDSVYNSGVDARSYGQTYGTLFQLLGGGIWNGGATCGSRAALCDHASALVTASSGCRGASEPLHRKAESRRPIY